MPEPSSGSGSADPEVRWELDLFRRRHGLSFSKGTGRRRADRHLGRGPCRNRQADQGRPIRKSDGSWTYFGADMAYHFQKAQGVDALIDIWGADHAGTVKRIKADRSGSPMGAGPISAPTWPIIFKRHRASTR